METHERIKYFRKEIKKLSQEKFGEELGVSRDVINNIESNRLKNPEQKEPLYRLIAEKFGINLAWIKCESVEMYPPKTRDQEITEIVKSASHHNPEEAAKFFTNLLSEMSDAEIVLMYEIFKRHFPAEAKQEDAKVTDLRVGRQKNTAAARSGDRMESNQVTQEEADSLLSNPCIGDI